MNFWTTYDQPETPLWFWFQSLNLIEFPEFGGCAYWSAVTDWMYSSMNLQNGTTSSMNVKDGTNSSMNLANGMNSFTNHFPLWFWTVNWAGPYFDDVQRWRIFLMIVTMYLTRTFEICTVHNCLRSAAQCLSVICATNFWIWEPSREEILHSTEEECCSIWPCRGHNEPKCSSSRNWSSSELAAMTTQPFRRRSFKQRDLIKAVHGSENVVLMFELLLCSSVERKT